jgi:tRNA 2-thiouridine synthesizing protein A
MNKETRDVDNIKADRVLDAKGLECPLPLLKAKKIIAALEKGQILEIIGTDEGSKVDLPGWCEHAGHIYLGARDEAGHFRFYIKKGT